MGVKSMMKEIAESDLDESTIQDLGDEAYEENNGIYEIISALHSNLKSTED